MIHFDVRTKESAVERIGLKSKDQAARLRKRIKKKGIPADIGPNIDKNISFLRIQVLNQPIANVGFVSVVLVNVAADNVFSLNFENKSERLQVRDQERAAQDPAFDEVRNVAIYRSTFHNW
jgi:hypothetical protein